MNHLRNLPPCNITLSGLILGASLALAGPAAHAATTISVLEDLYLSQDGYETGAPEGYYFDNWDPSDLDFLMGTGTWTASYPIIVAYDTSHTATFTLTSTTINSGAIYIGYKSDSTGTMTLNSSSHIESTSDITVGLSGTGTIQINNSTLHVNNATLGKNTGSTGTVNLDNGQLLVNNKLTLGAGTAHLTANNGSMISATSCEIANSLGARGDFTISGSGSMAYIYSSLTLGLADASNAGIGSILIENDALLTLGSANFSPVLTIADGSVMQLKDGFFAIYGDWTSNETQLIDDANLQVWDGTHYIAATTSNTNFNYYTSGEWASGDAVYDIYGSGLDLTGYTVVASAVPEPASFALFGGCGAMALVFYRKRRK